MSLNIQKNPGGAGPILDSLHKSTSLFGDKNLKFLPTLKLEFLSDTRTTGYLFFKNGVLKVTGISTSLHNYEEFGEFVWENNIINIDFSSVKSSVLVEKCNFNMFVRDLSIVKDGEASTSRLKSLNTAIGYLIHRFKDGTTTNAIILMDVYINGQPNGGSGKTLLINAIGEVRNLAIIDGKGFDQKEWFALSSVGLDTEVLLFDDVENNFNFEQIFPLMSTGMYKREKYKTTFLSLMKRLQRLR